MLKQIGWEAFVIRKVNSRVTINNIEQKISTGLLHILIALAGTMFLTISVWWFIGDVPQMNHRGETLRAKDKQKGRRRSNRFQLVWYHCMVPTLSIIPLEPVVKVILSAIGILVEVPLLQQLGKII